VDLLAKGLEEIGFEVELESFSYDLAPVEGMLRVTMLGGAGVIAVAGWLAAQNPLWSMILTAILILGGGLVLGWSPWLEHLYRRSGPTQTANVVGRRRVVDPARRLVLMAHHDSKSQSLALPARMGATMGAVFGLFGVALAAVVGALGRPDAVVGLGPVAGVVGGLSLLALATLTSGNESPGGVDNAGSLAIVLALAARLGELPPDLELVILFTGAEEDHMVGAMRWLDAHDDELTECPTHSLNFDGAGSPGRTVLITRFGWGRSFAPGLERAAVETATDLGLRVRRIIMAPAVGIDAIPFAHRGLECLSISSGSLGRATFAVHSADDVVENLDGPTMARIVDYAEAVIRRYVG